MRVAFLNPVATLGGAERVLLQNLRALVREADIQPSLLTMDDGPLIGEANALGVPARAIVAPAAVSGWGDSTALIGGRFSKLASGIRGVPEFPGFLRRIRHALNRIRPHLIHSNGIKTHLIGAMIRGQIPLVWHIHDFYSRRPLAAGLLRRASNGVRSAIAISRAVADDAGACLPGTPIDLVPNTVDCEHFSPRVVDADLLDCLSGMSMAPSGTIRVGLVAAFARWKGQDLFLQAVSELKRRGLHGRFRAYIIGGPIYRTQAQWSVEELRSLAAKLDVAGEVGFVPFQIDPVDIYRSLDIVVHASREPEPFGLTIAEAMACGRAAVVTQAGGAAELFDPGIEALAVPPNEASALADAITRLIEETDLRAALGQAARRRALQDFQPGRVGGQLTGIYRRCLAPVYG